MVWPFAAGQEAVGTGPVVAVAAVKGPPVAENDDEVLLDEVLLDEVVLVVAEPVMLAVVEELEDEVAEPVMLAVVEELEDAVVELAYGPAVVDMLEPVVVALLETVLDVTVGVAVTL
jgi:hypothetical protein